MERFTLVHVERKLWCVTARTGVPVYDFDFEVHFECRHPIRIEEPTIAIARMGAAQDYEVRYNELFELGVQLVHTPAEYSRTSLLPCWYPMLTDLTPRSVWFEEPPDVKEIERQFEWPVFIKGERQTSRHARITSIIESPEQFKEVMQRWERDSILWWQRVVCREYVPLRKVAAESSHTSHTIPKSFEFRTFWWLGECVGFGRYWTSETYDATKTERDEAIAIAAEAVKRVGVAFLVVDVAMGEDGRWWVIEVNDGQDSGYAGVLPLPMWRRMLDLSANPTPPLSSPNAPQKT